MRVGFLSGSVQSRHARPGLDRRQRGGRNRRYYRTAPSTQLDQSSGPGRDKLFIRGFWPDSSFNGPTQATTGQYLGDVRLNYNAPDPDLDLYDMKRVEVLVGPQRNASMACRLARRGVIRLVPNEPDADEISAGNIGRLSVPPIRWHQP